MSNMMEIGSRTLFSPEQDMFRENVRRFMREELAPAHDKYEKQGKVDKETWQRLGSQGKEPCFRIKTWQGDYLREMARSLRVPVTYRIV